MTSEEHIIEYRDTLVGLLSKTNNVEAKKLIKTYVALCEYFLDEDMSIEELQDKTKKAMR
ncbi:MAG: hypothetical protein WCK31_05265 [bacterium]